MSNIPTDIIIYAVLALVLVVWLGRVLGTKNGAESQRPNPFTRPPEGNAPKTADSVASALPAITPIKGVTSAVDAALVQIAMADRGFDAARFVENAKDAFALVVTAFADGDRETLRDLLAPAVFKSFDGEITRRELAGQKALTEVLSVQSADILEARLERNQASITLRFKADETYALSDADGKVIAGHPERVVTMTDVWVFTRDVKSSDPRWLVSETRDDVVEEHGMTLPEVGA